MDIKLQAFVGDTPPDHVDFRRSTGGFVGAPADNHRTILEFRVSDMDLHELGLTTEEALAACATVNKMIDAGTNRTKATVLDAISGFTGHKSGAGIALRVYDND